MGRIFWKIKQMLFWWVFHKQMEKIVVSWHYFIADWKNFDQCPINRLGFVFTRRSSAFLFHSPRMKSLSRTHFSFPFMGLCLFHVNPAWRAVTIDAPTLPHWCWTLVPEFYDELRHGMCIVVCVQHDVGSLLQNRWHRYSSSLSHFTFSFHFPIFLIHF